MNHDLAMDGSREMYYISNNSTALFRPIHTTFINRIHKVPISLRGGLTMVASTLSANRRAITSRKCRAERATKWTWGSLHATRNGFLLCFDWGHCNCFHAPVRAHVQFPLIKTCATCNRIFSMDHVIGPYTLTAGTARISCTWTARFFLGHSGWLGCRCALLTLSA